MEALEYAVAEPHASAWAGVTTTVGALVSGLPAGLGFVDFAPRFGVRVAVDQPVLAVECADLIRGGSVLLPEALVFVPSPPSAPELPLGATTTGLASGNTLEEATLHGLLEVMERDAVSMNQAHDRSQWVALDDLPQPFRTIAAHWRTLGIELAVRSVPNAFAALLRSLAARAGEHECRSRERLGPPPRSTDRSRTGDLRSSAIPAQPHPRRP